MIKKYSYIVHYCIYFLSLFNNPTESMKSFHLPTALITATALLIGYMIFYAKHTQKLAIPKDDGLLPGSKVIEINDKGIT